MDEGRHRHYTVVKICLIVARELKCQVNLGNVREWQTQHVPIVNVLGQKTCNVILVIMKSY